jgi:2-iminobutanoate/2-iminopropanoate deaminase
MSAPAIAAVATPNAPAALGPYSQAVSYSGPTLYVSGQIPLHPETMAVVGETAADQARQALKNMGAILEAGGSSPQRVLKVTVMLAEIADFAAVNEVYAEFFGDHKPARACFACKSLPKGVLIEVDCIAPSTAAAAGRERFLNSADLFCRFVGVSVIGRFDLRTCWGFWDSSVTLRCASFVLGHWLIPFLSVLVVQIGGPPQPEKRDGPQLFPTRYLVPHTSSPRRMGQGMRGRSDCGWPG